VEAVGRFKSERAHTIPFDVRAAVVLSRYLRDRQHGRPASRTENLRKAFVAAYDGVLSDVDVLVMPTAPVKAPVFESPSTPQEAIELELTGGSIPVDQIARNTWPFNYTGHPALTVPCAKPEGLPVGFQLVGPFWSEATLLRTAYAFQESVDWGAIVAVPEASGSRG
jgi:amidase